MSGTLVHVILSGIVSLIPQQNGSFEIRLQDARAEHAHFPTLLLESRNVAKAPPPDMLSTPRHALYQAWLIGDGKVVVGNAPRPPLDTSALTDVLRISDACPGLKCGIVDSSAISGVQLAARGGLLATTSLEPFHWRFTTEDESESRRIAEEICWTFEIQGTVLTLSVPSPRGGSRQFRIAAQPGEDIEIRLQNTEIIDVFPKPDPGVPELDTHVNIYFELSKYPPATPIYLQAQDKPGIATHPSHRLAGRRIARTLYQTPTNSTDTRQEKTIRAIRIDCPPALWDASESQSQ